MIRSQFATARVVCQRHQRFPSFHARPAAARCVAGSGKTRRESAPPGVARLPEAHAYDNTASARYGVRWRCTLLAPCHAAHSRRESAKLFRPFATPARSFRHIQQKSSATTRRLQRQAGAGQAGRQARQMKNVLCRWQICWPPCAILRLPAVSRRYRVPEACCLLARAAISAP